MKKKIEKRDPPIEPKPNLTPNLRYVSVHDVLTDRDKNSDPTEQKK